MLARSLTGIALATLALGLGACGAESERDAGQPASTQPLVEITPPDREQPADSVTPSSCPPGHPSCRSTEGRIVYVERVDPDGDGDAHFVVIDRQSITLPGLTAIDVRKGLRPHPLPGPGDLISAAGPVQTGSHGQSQIHALELHVAGE
jgi:hypothetical protein